MIGHGPPGTGKTDLAVACLFHYMDIGKQALYCPATHQALNEVSKWLAEQLHSARPDH